MGSAVFARKIKTASAVRLQGAQQDSFRLGLWGKITFHLDGEFPQQVLQFRLNGAHVLGRDQDTGIRASFAHWPHAQDILAVTAVTT